MARWKLLDWWRTTHDKTLPVEPEYEIFGVIEHIAEALLAGRSLDMESYLREGMTTRALKEVWGKGYAPMEELWEESYNSVFQTKEYRLTILAIKRDWSKA